VAENSGTGDGADGNGLELVADEYRRLAELGRILSSARNVDEAFATFAEQVHLLVPFDRLAISTVDPVTEQISDTHVSGIQTETLNRTGPYSLADSALPTAVYEKHEVVVANSALLSDLSQSDVAADNKVRIAAGLKSAMFVPLVLQGALVGSLVLRSKDEDPYGARESELAEQIAAQIAGTVSSQRQFALVNRQAAEREQLTFEQATIAEIGRIVGSTTEFDLVLSKFAAQAQKLVPHDRVVIATWSDDGLSLTDRYVNGIELEGLSAGRAVSVPQDEVWHRLYNEKKSWCVKGHDYIQYKERNERERARYKAGLRAILIVPILLQQKLVGSIAFRSTNPDAFDDRQIELADSIASQIAGAVAAGEQLREKQQLSEEQATIAEIGRIASSSLDIDEVLGLFVDQAKRLIPFDRLVISINDEDGINATDAYVSGDELEPGKVGASYAIAGGLKQVATENSYLVAGHEELIEHAKKWPAEQDRLDAGYRSLLMVPMVSRGIEVGTLMFRTKGENDYSGKHVLLGKQISAAIAGAIAASEQVRKLEKESATVQRLADEQAVIAEIGRIVSSSLDIDEVFELFVQQAKRLIPFDRLVISINDESGENANDAYISGESIQKGVPGGSHPVAGGLKEMASKNSYLVANHEALIGFSKKMPEEQIRLEAGFRSLLMVPMVTRGIEAGTLIFRSKGKKSYSDRHVSLGKQIAAEIAGAIAASEHIRKLETESATVQRLADDQAIIAEIGRIVSSSLNIDDVFASFAGQARKLIPFDRISVMLVEESRKSVVDAFVHGMEDVLPGAGVRREIEPGTSLHNLIEHRVQVNYSGKEYADHAAMSLMEKRRYELGLNSILASPIIWNDTTIGAITFRAMQSEIYGEREQAIASQICAQIAGAITTSNQYQLIEQALADIGLQSTALEAADDAIVIRGTDSKVIYVNSGFERQTGVTREEVVGTNFLYPENDEYTGAVDDIWEVIKAGESWRQIIPSKRKDGTPYVVDATINPVFNESGEIVQFVGVRRDVTESVNANAEIRTQLAALQAAAEGFIILTPDFTIEWVNDSFVRDTGYSEDELIGKKAPVIPSGENHTTTFDDMPSTVLAGKSWRATHTSLRKDGTEYHVESSVTPVMGDDGEIVRLIGTRRDITDIVNAEKEREARRDLDARNRQLLELNEQRQEFFSTVSHELRTPLTAVIAFADILARDRDGTLTGLQKEHIDVIKRNSRNLNDLVEDMLDFSRMSTDKLKLEKSTFEIHSLVDSLVESLEPTAHQRDQKLLIEPFSNPVWVEADHGRIVQVISNLVNNSCKYSPPETKVSVGVEFDEEEQRVWIKVTDEGIGIDASDIENIFSPFFRTAQSGVLEEKGTGLGLAISKTLVELHGGTIRTESKLGEGTSISVSLPGASTEAPKLPTG